MEEKKDQLSVSLASLKEQMFTNQSVAVGYGSAGVRTAGQNHVISQLYKYACNLVLVSCSRLGPVRGPERRQQQRQ